ncbi:hypothetical protein A2153_02975 [Candidatus Gottesmanbacteria bacterium RBG_16_38_7b]|uniref:AlgX/AlgJ SGNH hydrolase-like domain-containing protein n=1 Tax=Candidatus Gottesmanbacteria bacterium RBG_16_38_7b TaxID=1798372 RepID=A0A1F5YJ12_9BACT|nr:MAG: hypothetical protein A2153_02975 [Candidatus Gottesmanbacteria bacterium RBG_16_38_7b]
MVKKIIIFLTIILIGIGIAEFIIRRFKPQQTYSKSVENSINCYDKNSLIPFTLAKNHTCRMVNINGEYSTTATMNSLGYRGKEFTDEKKVGVKRIMIVGDSMTFGWGVADNETYPFLTENLLKAGGRQNIEVINAGYIGGLSLDSFYVYLKNEGMKLKPDLVIVSFFIFNDIEDLAANKWVKVDGKGLPEKIESCCHEVDGNILRNKIISFKYRYPILQESHFYLAIIDLLQRRFRMFPDRALLSTKGEEYLGCTLNPDCRDKFREEEVKALKLITKMKKITEEEGGEFLVLVLPVDYQIYPEASAKYERYGMKWYLVPGEEDFAQKRLAELLYTQQIDYLDLLPEYREKKNGAYPFYPIDAHFNPVGTKIAAEGLVSFLIKNNIIN